jgi:hypothetical protein
MISTKIYVIEGGPTRPPLPEAIILISAPFAPLFSHRVWLYGRVVLVGALLDPGARTVTVALRVDGVGSGAPQRPQHPGERLLSRCATLYAILNRSQLWTLVW